MQLWKRLLWGARVGAIFGSLFALVALVVFVLGGQRAFDVQHTSLGSVLLTYLLGGVGAGLITGLLRPLTAWKIGAALVGFLAAIPVGVLLRSATGGSGPWSGSEATTLVIFCAVLGAPLGVAYREVFADRNDTTEPFH
jgi:hypothetical protein